MNTSPQHTMTITFWDWWERRQLLFLFRCVCAVHEQWTDISDTVSESIRAKFTGAHNWIGRIVVSIYHLLLNFIYISIHLDLSIHPSIHPSIARVYILHVYTQFKRLLMYKWNKRYSIESGQPPTFYNIFFLYLMANKAAAES